MKRIVIASKRFRAAVAHVPVADLPERIRTHSERYYTFREWAAPPGGRAFSRIQSAQARESWRESLDFLKRHLRGRRGN